jgi:MFS family permease
VLAGFGSWAQGRAAPGTTAHAGWYLSYVLVVVVIVAAVAFEARAAAAFVDFAPDRVGRRSKLLLAIGLAAALVGCVGFAVAGDLAGIPRALAVSLSVAGLAIAACGAGGWLASAGADWAGRKVGERADDEW